MATPDNVLDVNMQEGIKTTTEDCDGSENPSDNALNRTAEPSNEESALSNPVRRGGPRTQAGKERSKRNATKHGIFARVVLIEGESRAQLNSFLGGFRDYFQPVGAFEESLVELAGVILWRFRRFMAIDASDTSMSMPLDLLVRYEGALMREFDRVIALLERAQRIRLGQPVAPRIEVDLK